MYIETVAGISKRYEFASRVDADNIASQNLMEKLGFQPYGLSEFLLHKEEVNIAYETLLIFIAHVIDMNESLFSES